MSNTFNKSVEELIQIRHSVRSYDSKPLSNELINNIEKYIESVDNPFNKNIRIKLVKKDSYDKAVKLGTYGVIKGANYFLVAACDNDDLSLVSLGYTLEKVILYCTSLGLGTVWIGGTFNRGDFAKTMNLGPNEILPIVSPLGYEGGKKSFIASLIGDNSNKRKSIEEICFNNDFNTPLQPDKSSEYFKPLDMLRLAPSALNKQPWRILKKDNNLHFYLASDNHMNKVDIGIALCHFHLTAMEDNLNGKFEMIDSMQNLHDKFTYVMSWISE